MTVRTDSLFTVYAAVYVFYSASACNLKTSRKYFKIIIKKTKYFMKNDLQYVNT